jgi:BirA family biotin operon repressor/biotin-[acetyl-CoA-carboxylase] ligase
MTQPDIPQKSYIDIDTLRSQLETAIIGRTLQQYEQVGSTSDLVREQAHGGAAEGLVILAEEQTVGRGRLGRAWAAPSGTSILMSLLLRPSWLAPESAFLLTMMAAVALCEAVEDVAPHVRAGLKWPNDLMLPLSSDTDGPLRKSAGILSELVLSGERVAWVSLGIGVNVNWAPTGVVDGRDLGRAATSVGAAAGSTVDRSQLLINLLKRLDTRYLALRRGQQEALFVDWRARLVTLGQRVSVNLPAAVIQGVAEDVEPSGALRLRDEQGKLHVITAGDVGG